MPAWLWMQSEPTEKNRLAMAMPKRPSLSRARMDQVMRRPQVALAGDSVLASRAWVQGLGKVSVF
jgi:hypothetical protein